MCDRIKVKLKSLVTEKNSLMSIGKIIYTAIGYISSVFAFAVLIKDMMSIDTFQLKYFKENLQELYIMLFPETVLMKQYID